MGNPNLSPLTATNFDLSAEYYIGRGGILSIAAFYKSIANPIYSTTVVESGTFAGRDLTDAQVTTAVNADSAKGKGIELHAQIELDVLPSPLHGLTAGGSMPFVDSNAQEIGEATSRVSVSPYVSISLVTVSYTKQKPYI